MTNMTKFSAKKWKIGLNDFVTYCKIKQKLDEWNNFKVMSWQHQQLLLQRLQLYRFAKLHDKRVSNIGVYFTYSLWAVTSFLNFDVMFA